MATGSSGAPPSSSPASIPHLPALGASSPPGSLFIGFVLSTVLYGWFLSQVWTYYRHYVRDSTVVKSIVALLVLAETGATVGCAQSLYHTLVQGFGNPLGILDIGTGLAVFQLCHTLVVFFTQIFYAYRLRRLEGGVDAGFAITAAVTFLALVALACGIVVLVFVLQLKTFDRLGSLKVKIVIGGLSGSSSLCDLIVTWAIYRFLEKSRNGMKTTEHAIARICKAIIQRGILLFIVQITTFAVFLSSPKTLLYIIPYQVEAKLYSNTMLAFLLSFEPNKLSVRTDGLGSHDDPFVAGTGTAHGINLEVIQSTDAYVYHDAETKRGMARKSAMQ